MQVFDSIPPQAWIALALAITALAPASYVWRHLTHGIAPRDITLPPEDLEWKSDRQLYRCLAILVGLLGLGAFVFTPQAEAFARSDWFLPTIFGAVGTFALGTLLPGWHKGEIEPLIRGVSQSYSKHEHPKRYWASLAWNAALGSGLMTASLGLVHGNATPDCDDDSADRAVLLDNLVACDAVLAEFGSDEARRADLLGDRGRVHHRLGNDENALADYSEALEFEPDDSYTLYNRALIHERLDNRIQAIQDFSASLALRPDNNEAYLSRGLAYLDSGRFEESILDFTRLHERDPDNPYALANRGIAHAWLGQADRAERDFQRFDVDAEAWPVVLRGRAVLAFRRQDFPETIRYLTQALEIDPDDYFSLRMRADAFWEVGEHDLARDDDDRTMAMDQTKEPADF